MEKPSFFIVLCQVHINYFFFNFSFLLIYLNSYLELYKLNQNFEGNFVLETVSIS